ncbi:HD-GYP domain-containing protein [Clostridium manihotivorum]|uniref:HD family phosphohydrolase n=1 Tax=Clostridium manihotivorum TaxID=2320868 RepID=A0A410DNS5_9CLOT|nr:HD-GYP domain-containing protein [Clostridium manihotivorum]QAA30725.1 HD family phosphohydrolase [Clostridium manihotivorum]
MNIFQQISSHQLKNGMIVAKDLTINNLTLLTKGTEITENIAEKIKLNFPLSDIVIYSETNPDNSSLFENRNSIKIAKIEKSFSKMSEVAESIFDSIKDTDKFNMSEVRSISDSIMEQLTETGLVIKNIIDERNEDKYLTRHCVNVATISSLIGKWLQLQKKELIFLTYSALLHDIGKIKIDPRVLNKKSKLTEDEVNLCRTHSTLGYDIAKKVPYIDQSILFGILFHHEREDGTGYPLKVKGPQIPKFAKIIAIADIFDAMTSNRVYKNKQCALDVLEEIKCEIFGKLDPVIGTVFINNILNYYIGELVLLSTGKIGKVVKIDLNSITRPWISIDGNIINLNNEPTIRIVDLI